MLDLAKAPDSVDREMAWQILLSRGAPPKLVALIRDRHTHHSPVTRSKVDYAPVGTTVGFKQGYVLAQPLCNVCCDSVICQLQLQRHLLQDIRPKRALQKTQVMMQILLYADDISLACDTAEKLREAVITMDATCLQSGFTISIIIKKTKVLIVGRNAAAQAADSVIMLRGDQAEVVSHYKYLGIVFTSDCTSDAETLHGVALKPQTPKKTMGTSAHLGAGVAQFHNY